MIKLMFRITDEQIVGGPDWINTELWDVRAKAEHPTSVCTSLLAPARSRQRLYLVQDHDRRVPECCFLTLRIEHCDLAVVLAGSEFLQRDRELQADRIELP